ncbi:putative LOC107395108-like protein [Nothobranchius furzeri]|uniref:LOC107395108-like protein n=4 Tax=Nothobranchius TaxID=28779 RepID=A0A1A7Z8Q4_NOTFU|nr:putative LOC107395108-like protein [Nothobranchius furzeri]
MSTHPERERMALRDWSQPAERTVVGGMGMNHEESALILIRHCQDMKRQEARLRLISLLLMLSCAAFFFYTNTSGSQERSPEPGKAFWQQSPCPSENGGIQPPLRIFLRANLTTVENDSVLSWESSNSIKSYDKETDSIVIPGKGFYFVYIRFTLVCDDRSSFASQAFAVQLQLLSRGYPHKQPLLEAKDRWDCSDFGFHNVFVGELFELEKEDLLSVFLIKGSHMVTASQFGVFHL